MKIEVRLATVGSGGHAVIQKTLAPVGAAAALAACAAAPTTAPATPSAAAAKSHAAGPMQELDHRRQAADLVTLSDNPLTIEPMKINKIVVLETTKEGKTVYSRK